MPTKRIEHHKQRMAELGRLAEELSQKISELHQQMVLETRQAERQRLWAEINRLEASRDRVWQEQEKEEEKLNEALDQETQPRLIWADNSERISVIDQSPAGVTPTSNEAIQVREEEVSDQTGVAFPGGALHHGSSFYVERREDQLIKELIKRQGVTITIKGPRYVGKSSMLMRLEAEVSNSKRVVILDFRQFGLGQPELAKAEVFFYQFCKLLTDELRIEDQIERYWHSSYSLPQRCTRYMERYLLKQLDRPLVLAMDDVDRVFNTGFCDDFFGMLRGWHDYRARVAQPIWRQLDLVLVTSTEPYRFIKDPNQSLFNVSVIIDLPDFTTAQVNQLNHYYGAPLKADEVRRLMDLVAGHPDLVRRALEWVASIKGSPTELFGRASDDHGPFGPHLKRHLTWLLEHPEEKAAMLQVLEHQTLSKASAPIFFRLEGAGLVYREKDRVEPRCQLYADYFKGTLYE